jgi:hypothetical protein
VLSEPECPIFQVLRNIGKACPDGVGKKVPPRRRKSTRSRIPYANQYSQSGDNPGRSMRRMHPARAFISGPVSEVRILAWEGLSEQGGVSGPKVVLRFSTF